MTVLDFRRKCKINACHWFVIWLAPASLMKSSCHVYFHKWHSALLKSQSPDSFSIIFHLASTRASLMKLSFCDYFLMLLAPGGSWRLLGCSLRLMAAPVGPWQLLAALGGTMAGFLCLFSFHFLHHVTSMLIVYIGVVEGLSKTHCIFL